MQIDILDKTGNISDDDMELFEQLALFVGRKENIPDIAEVSVNFVDNDEIRVLNRDYRDKDAVTDVISFALQEHVEGEINIVSENMPIVLGDIVISVDKAKEQANEFNHSIQRELGFLIVHGFLHLLGYDHINEEDEQIMLQKQAKLLGEFGLER